MSDTPLTDEIAYDCAWRGKTVVDMCELSRRLERERAELIKVVRTELGFIRAISEGQGKPLQEAFLDTIAQNLEAALAKMKP